MNFYDDLLTYLSPFILLLGVIIGTINYGRLNSVNRLLLMYLILSLSIDITSRLVILVSDNNLFLWFILSLMELLVFSKFYYDLVEKKRVIGFFTFLGISYLLVEVCFIDMDKTAFQTYSRVVVSFLIVGMILRYFWERVITSEVVSKKNLNLNFGILTYFALNVVLLLPVNLLINIGSDSVIYLWYIYLSTTVLFYIYITYHLWRNGKKPKQ